MTMLATAPLCSIFLSLCPMADQVHVFNGVRYVPIEAISDFNRKWLSAGWLSKKMTLNNSTRPSRPTLGLRSTLGKAAGWGTTCDLSSLKWARDERQRSMKCDTHRAAVWLHYNRIPQ